MTRQPPLAGVHEACGAKSTEFGGWEMPVQFDSIGAEHESVRESAGKFDVSHMSEIEVTGPDAAALTDRLVTNDIETLDSGRARYAAITDEEGMMLDDTVIYRRGPESVLFVPNAGHDERMTARWREYRDEHGLDAEIRNATTDWGMLAVQGPEAQTLMADVVEGEATGVTDLARFGFREVVIEGCECLLSRTGYTGEDGFEVLCPWAATEELWERIECQPCGLGARDTLRIEAGLLLSGQDFDPESDPRSPLEAGIGFAVALDGGEFVGREALLAIEEVGPTERLTGFELLDRGVPRHGYPITDGEGTDIGRVTSGTMSPTLERPIGLGYLPAEYDGPIAVAIRGEEKRARIEPPPFIDR